MQQPCTKHSVALLVLSVLCILLVLTLAASGVFVFKVLSGTRTLLGRLGQSYGVQLQSKHSTSKIPLSPPAPGSLTCSVPATLPTTALPSSYGQYLSVALDVGARLFTAAVKDDRPQAITPTLSSPLGPEWTVVESPSLPFFCAVAHSKDVVVGAAVPPDEVLVVFRGTSSIRELYNDDMAVDYVTAQQGCQEGVKFLASLGIPLPFPPQVPLYPSSSAKVNVGFLSALTSVLPGIKSAVERLMGGGSFSLAVGGHSLGAGVACTLACGAPVLLPSSAARPAALYCSGCPRVGNSAFSAQLSKLPVVCILENLADPIPSSPDTVIPDLTEPSGNLVYAPLPQSYIFTCIGDTLIACHAISAYRSGLEALLRSKAAAK